jgi:hypothetical protein
MPTFLIAEPSSMRKSATWGRRVRFHAAVEGQDACPIDRCGAWAGIDLARGALSDRNISSPSRV